MKPRIWILLSLFLLFLIFINFFSLWNLHHFYALSIGGLIFLLFINNALLIFLNPYFQKKPSTALTRVIRAFLNPLWVHWTFFSFFYSLTLLIFSIFFKCVPWFHAEDLKWVSSFFISGWVVLLGWGIYTALVPLHLSRFNIVLPRLPASFNGFKIAIGSDFHIGLFSRTQRLTQIFETMAAYQPDLVVLLGDLTDDDAFYIPKLLKGIEVLDPHLPILGILGNHDIYGDPHSAIQQLAHSRVHLLINEGFEFKKNAESIWIAGISDYAATYFEKLRPHLVPDFNRTLAHKPPSSPTILLAHQPKAFHESIKRHIELTLCGHTHGGQLGFPFLNWTIVKPFITWDRGLFQNQGSQLLVTSGVGYWGAPFRLGLQPELVFLNLQFPLESHAHV